MSNTDIKISDFAAREFPYKSQKTVERWARDGKIPGAHKDPGGRWVVDIAQYHGINFSADAVNDIGVNDDVFKKLQAQ